MRKRTLSLVICVVMAFSLLIPCLSAMATDTPAPATGEAELVKAIDVNTVVEGDGQKVKTIVYHLASVEGLDGLTAEDFSFTGKSYAWASKHVGEDPYSPAAYRTEEAEAFEAEIAGVKVDADAKTLTVSVGKFPPKYYYVADYSVACAANDGLSFSNETSVNDDMSFNNSNGKVSVHTPYAEEFKYVKGAEGLSYYLYSPENAGKKALPLVLSNHGSGDHMTLLANRVSLSFAEDGVQDKYPSYVLAPVYPQQPHNAEDADAAAEKQAKMQDLVIEETIAVIKDMVAKGLVDPDRIYVSGKSMGGGNTVRIAIQYPDLFAAALPLCPGGRANDMDISAIKDMPVWFLVGEFDGLAPSSKEMYQKLVDAGSYKAKITVYSPEVMYARGIAKHHDVEIIALEDMRYFDWLYAQSKPKGKIDYVRVNTETAPRGHTISSIDIYAKSVNDATALGKGAFAQKLTGDTYNWASSKVGGVYRSAKTVPFEARVKNVTVTGNKVSISFDPLMGYVENNPENGVDTSYSGYKKYFYVKDFKLSCLEDPAFTITKADVNDTTAMVADGFAQQSQALGADLEYNLYAPTGTITQKVEASEGKAEVPEKREAMPLVVVLHGSGDQGNLYANRMAVAWAEEANMAARPAYILAPVYTEQGSTESLNATTAKVAALIEQMIADGLVDPDRVTVMGKSMGGKNTQRMYKDYPDLLAAAMPISGGIPQEFMDEDGLPMRELVNSFAGRPFYIVHSEGDSSTKQSENLYAAIKKEDGSKLLFKEYTAEEFKKLNVKPHDVEIVAMEDPQFMEWLYSQSKAPTPAEPATEAVTEADTAK